MPWLCWTTEESHWNCLKWRMVKSMGTNLLVTWVPQNAITPVHGIMVSPSWVVIVTPLGKSCVPKGMWSEWKKQNGKVTEAPSKVPMLAPSTWSVGVTPHHPTENQTPRKNKEKNVWRVCECCPLSLTFESVRPPKNAKGKLWECCILVSPSVLVGPRFRTSGIRVYISSQAKVLVWNTDPVLPWVTPSLLDRKIISCE
jgi:hypothetical protein